jgi:hypothetical protein
LSPIVPIIFHTGTQPWATHRTLATLIEGPEEFARFAPNWEPLFWDVAERSPEELLETTSELLTTLAVVRAEEADEATFRAVFARVLSRLEALSERERVRWHDLLWFVLSWAMRRRPGDEQADLLRSARGSQADVARQEEIEKMAKAIGQSWEEELLERGRVETLRENLLWNLEQRFGTLSEGVVARIRSTQAVDRLRAAFRQSLDVTSPEELEL